VKHPQTPDDSQKRTGKNITVQTYLFEELEIKFILAVPFGRISMAPSDTEDTGRDWKQIPLPEISGRFRLQSHQNIFRFFLA
jgi:hypothetical protein